MKNRLQILMLFVLSAIFLLSSCRKEYYRQELRLEGVWYFNKVKSCNLNGTNVQNLTSEWNRDELEFILPDEVFYYDDETGAVWEGVWEMERYTNLNSNGVDDNVDADVDYILSMALVNPDNGELDLRTMTVQCITNRKLRLVDKQKYEEMRFWLEQ